MKIELPRPIHSLRFLLFNFFSQDESCNPFTADLIDASSYTHIVFSFASISDTGTLESWDFEEDVKKYSEFLAVKDKYPDAKFMIAVGGWTHNDPDNERLYRFSNIAATLKSRAKFAQSSVAFLRKYGFDGYVMLCFHLFCPSDFAS